MSQKITPFLWFDGKAEEAAKFYTSIFKKSKILSANPMSVTFRLAGQKFMALNGGPQYKFTPALSLFVSCKNQKEIDHYWKKLSAGGELDKCGWLRDKFGVSWQIIPSILGDLLWDKDKKKAGRAMAAMLKMTKLDIAKLKKAHSGKTR